MSDVVVVHAGPLVFETGWSVDAAGNLRWDAGRGLALWWVRDREHARPGEPVPSRGGWDHPDGHFRPVEARDAPLAGLPLGTPLPVVLAGWPRLLAW